MIRVQCKTCTTSLGEAADSIAASHKVVEHIRKHKCDSGVVSLICDTCGESIDYGPESGLDPDEAATRVAQWEWQHEHKEQA